MHVHLPRKHSPIHSHRGSQNGNLVASLFQSRILISFQPTKKNLNLIVGHMFRNKYGFTIYNPTKMIHRLHNYNFKKKKSNKTYQLS